MVVGKCDEEAGHDKTEQNKEQYRRVAKDEYHLRQTSREQRYRLHDLVDKALGLLEDPDVLELQQLVVVVPPLVVFARMDVRLLLALFRQAQRLPLSCPMKLHWLPGSSGASEAVW